MVLFLMCNCGLIVASLNPTYTYGKQTSSPAQVVRVTKYRAVLGGVFMCVGECLIINECPAYYKLCNALCVCLVDKDDGLFVVHL